MKKLDKEMLKDENYDKAYSDFKHAIKSMPSVEKNQKKPKTDLKTNRN